MKSKQIRPTVTRTCHLIFIIHCKKQSFYISNCGDMKQKNAIILHVNTRVRSYLNTVYYLNVYNLYIMYRVIKNIFQLYNYN